MSKKRIYLDHYRTTPVRKEVLERMLPYFSDRFWLPAPFVSTGTEIGEIVEKAKETVSEALNLKEGEVLFTPGGTYANNLVIHGILRDENPVNVSIVASSICHISILKTYNYYSKKGANVRLIRVDSEGYIDTEELKKTLNSRTKLVAITHVNHTIGTIQRINEITKIVKEFDENIPVLIDGAMAVNSIGIDLEKTPADFFTLSGHKIYGPKGTGLLVVKDKKKLKPILFGNADTSPYTPGAENIPGIVGITEALRLAAENRKQYTEHSLNLQKQLSSRIEKEIPDVILNGPSVGERAVDNLNYSFRYIEGESVTLFLDFENIIVATGSACASSDLKVNYVLSAIGRDHELAHGSLRITTGWDNTEEDISTFVERLKPIVERLRKQSTIRTAGGRN